MILSFAKFFLRMLGGVLAGIMIAAMLIGVRLALGPIEVDFLGPYLEEALTENGSPFQVALGQTSLGWEPGERALVVEAGDVAVRDDHGQPVLQVPKFSVSLAASGLMRGRIVPRSAALVGLDLNLLRDREGRIAVAVAGSGRRADFARGADDGADGDDATAFLRELVGIRGDGSLGPGLERLSILESRVTFTDQASESVISAPQADLRFLRAGDALRLGLDAEIEAGAGLVPFRADAAWVAGESHYDVTLAFGEIRPSVLPFADALPAVVAGIDVPVSGDLRFAIDLDGRVESIDFAAHSGAGTLYLETLYPDPVTIRNASITGRLSGGGTSLHVARAVLALDGPRIAFSGDVGFDGDRSPSIRMEATADRVTIDEVKRYWPPDVSRDGRDWVVGHLDAGAAHNVVLKLDLPAGAIDDPQSLAPDAVALDFDFDGIAARYFDPLPPIEQGRGHGRLDIDRLVLAVAGATAGGLEVGESEVVIRDFRREDQRAVIRVQVAGPVETMLAALDRPPLGLPSRIGLEAGIVTGRGAVTVNLDFPLIDELTDEMLGISATATLEGIDAKGVALGHDIADGAFTLDIGASRIGLSGRAAILGVPMDIVWEQPFVATGEVAAHYRLAGEVPTDRFAAFGLPLAPYAGGSVGLTTSIDDRVDGNVAVTVDLDLANTVLAVDQAGWGKPAGTPGKAAFSLLRTPDGALAVEGLAVEAGDLQAEGRFRVEDATLVMMQLPKLRFGGSDLAVDLIRKNDAYVIDAAGARLDLKPVFGPDEGGEAASPPAAEEPAGDGPRYLLAGRFARVGLAEDIDVTALDVVLHGQGEIIDYARVRGTLEGGAEVALGVVSRDGKRYLNIDSGDGGGVLKAIGVAENVVEGRLRLRAVKDDTAPEEPLTGRLEIKDFRVVKAPVLAQVLTVASLGGIADLVNGDGARFRIAEVPFSYGDGVITVNDARAVGSIGITAKGTFTRDGQRLAIEGTIIPSYTLNSVLGAIPLIGDLLVGRQGEGIFGITYVVNGTADNPEIEVNPLSALAPGILRRMFFEPRDGKIVEPPTLQQRN
ncbi:YhdP family protein [Oceanibacterium hippocampi]|uniref:YhdP central domain-containing protein n=1 Tax=Oceanibacterium hippocampi TaxID=745714 RepID=A0A1Y5SVM0_9PROT|nr:AsmA-like C-terminal region-containing protein [Oceanibacterium hippocampi]SLN49332.1 hypothetical protein OCH7691_02157 [Oceanibacterium hippocampi]